MKHLKPYSKSRVQFGSERREASGTITAWQAFKQLFAGLREPVHSAVSDPSTFIRLP